MQEMPDGTNLVAKSILTIAFKVSSQATIIYNEFEIVL